MIVGPEAAPEYIKAARLVDEWKDCVCGARIQRGFTVLGKPAWFEEVPDEESGEMQSINHWAVCRTPDKAREIHAPTLDGTRQGKCPRCTGGALVYARGGATCASCGWSSVPPTNPTRRRRYGGGHGRRISAYG